jgi:two-component system, OmpR family, phosphate regulon sensor histidine kinase PhoR
MFERRSLKWPISLGVVLIVLIIALAVGWVLLSVFGAVENAQHAGVYWTLLSIGSVVIVAVLAGVIAYLVLTVRSINLTRRQSNFIDSVTHELKTPIASLKLYLQTLERRVVSPSERERFQEMMMEDVQRLEELINHLLDAARVERRKRVEPPSMVRLDEVIIESAGNVCQRHRVDPAAISLELGEVLVPAFSTDLTIIVRNLLDNAIKYGGRPPQVRVRLIPAGPGRISLQVADNGSGIPRHLRRRIFGRFVRLGSELERQQPGTGLGLFLVRSLVKSIGGQIRVRDRRGTLGTEFEVTMPGEWVVAGRGWSEPSTQRRAASQPTTVGESVE